MALIDKVIKELSLGCFDGHMPKKLHAYLLDRYTSRTSCDVLTEDFLYAAIGSDIEQYKKGTLDTTVRSPLERLRDEYDELSDILRSFAEDRDDLNCELEYMYGFIRWMGLLEEYADFRMNAHKYQPEDEPFPYYTM